MANHFKITDSLGAEDREAFEAVARDPRTTHAMLLEWLGEHGYQIGKSSVGRWKKSFDATLASVRESAELAAAYRGAMGDSVEDVQAATLMRHSQRMLQMVMDDGDLEAGDAVKISQAIRQNIGSAKENLELKAKVRELESQQKAAMAAAEKAVKAGGSAAAVENAVREAMGLRAA